MDQLQSPLHTHLRNLLATGRHSDLLLKSSIRSYALHHLCVCTRSDFFIKACCFNDPTRCGGTIDLSHSDPHAVDCLIQFLYLDNYDIQTITQLNTEQDIASTKPFTPYTFFTSAADDGRTELYSLALHARIYILANYCLLPDLKSLALRKFNNLRPKSYDPIRHVPAFIQLVREIYTSTNDTDADLRNATASIFKDHLRVLLPVKAAEDLLLEISHLGRDIARQYI